MRKREPDNCGPSLNIWQARCGFKVICSKNKEVIIYKNDFLYLINFKGSFATFRTGSAEEFKIHKDVMMDGKIERVYPDGV